MKLFFLILCLPALLQAFSFTCRELKVKRSGVYMINLPSGSYKVYCEMEINGGGYTFIAKNDMRRLKQNDLTYLFKNRGDVLLRLINRNTLQPYTVIQALNGKQNLGVRVNNYLGYTRPKNLPLYPYLFLGILPARSARNKGIQGFKSNGKQVQFRNCDKNPNSYFAFFANPSNKRASGYIGRNLIFEKRGVAVDWRKTALLKKGGCNMPESYFYFTELHFGGCGTYTSSDRWSKTGYTGTAIGLR